MADTSVSPSSAERAASQALQDAEDGSPVVTVITKRLRAAKKRLGKIELIEAKPQERLNKEQEESLKTKPKTLATIEELERLIPLLETAKEDEIKAAVNKAVDKALADEKGPAANDATSVPQATAAAHQPPDQSAIFSILKLLYFSQTFDLQRVNAHMAPLERSACLDHYKYQAPDQSQPLSEDDLQLLCKLGGLMLMRRTDEPISHEEALQEAHGLALKWLQRSNEPVPSVEGASMGRVNSILDRATSTTYMTVKPVLSTNLPEGQTAVADSGIGYENQSYHAQQHFQGPPMTPDLRQQETYAPATDSSLPPSQESSFSYYPDTAPSHDPSYYQEYGSGQVGYQNSHPGMPASQQGHPEAYLNYTHNGSVKSDGHASGAQQHDMYSHPQQPQAYASGSLDGSQTNGDNARQSAYGYSETYSGSLDGSTGHPLRQRGEGSRPSNLIYRGGYRGKGAPVSRDAQPPAQRGRGRGESRGRGRDEYGRGEYGRGRGRLERAPRGRGEAGRGSRGRGPPRHPDESPLYEM